jgi:hypothetical protein
MQDTAQMDGHLTPLAQREFADHSRILEVNSDTINLSKMVDKKGHEKEEI